MSLKSTQLTNVRKNARRLTTPFKEFAKYEDRQNRSLRFDVNALADFEQETGMGFAQLMKQRAIFGSARAMIWAGLKHEDRGLTIEYVGDLLSEYIRDEDVAPGEHTIDTILMVAFNAAIEQGALGVQRTQPEDAANEAAVDAVAVEDKADPSLPPQQLP